MSQVPWMVDTCWFALVQPSWMEGQFVPYPRKPTGPHPLYTFSVCGGTYDPSPWCAEALEVPCLPLPPDPRADIEVDVTFFRASPDAVMALATRRCVLVKDGDKIIMVIHPCWGWDQGDDE